MIQPKLVELADRTTIRLGGPDARALLQKLLTVDFDDVSRERSAYGALLTPQGKILFDFFLAEADDSYLIDCAVIQKTELMQRLAFYRLRASMTIEDLSAEMRILALWDSDIDALPAEAGATMTRGDGLFYRDPRVAEAGLRAFVPRSAHVEGRAALPADYHRHRIALGLADTVMDIGSGELFPHEANFDQFRGVDFAKGCYVGQEVVSRMEHRGTGARKRIVPVAARETHLVSQAEITAGNKHVGTVLSAMQTHGLALVRLDRAEEAASARLALRTGDSDVLLCQPAWARYTVPTTDLAA